MRKVRFQKTGPFRSKSKIGNFFTDKKLNSPGAFFLFKNIISAKLKALNFAPYLQEIKFSLQSSVILQIAGSRLYFVFFFQQKIFILLLERLVNFRFL